MGSHFSIPSRLPHRRLNCPCQTQPRGTYELTNRREDNYQAVQLSVRQRFSSQYEWMLSYTRSRAVSNALLDYNGSDPLQVLSSPVPVPWDAPNRAIGWAYLPLPWKNWAVAAMADARSGFPFSIQDQTGLIIGPVDSHRYGYNFDLNLALERMVTFRGVSFRDTGRSEQPDQRGECNGGK